MQNMKLNNGTTIPPIGLGLWLVKDEQECKAAVRAGLDIGYRHFDTAQVYGNEAFLGAALQEAGAKRDELFITTKIWNENQHTTDLVPSFEESLKNLQTDYVDLLLLHFPVSELRQPAWQEMEKLATSGRAKAIGVSNYTVRHLEELLAECSIKPAVNQVELHVFLQQPELATFCKKHDILVEAYSPLAHGYGLDNPTLLKLSKKHNKTTAQIMLRWCLEMQTLPLPKSVHADRLQKNFDIFDFTLDAEDMAELAKLDKNYRTAWDPTNVA